MRNEEKAIVKYDSAANKFEEVFTLGKYEVRGHYLKDGMRKIYTTLSPLD